MPHVQSRQETSVQSQESALGDGVPINGVEGQAARRAHMREQTTARQAAERRLGNPPLRRQDFDYRGQVAERVVEVRAELARINAEHRTWLREQGVVVTMHSKRGRHTLEPA